MPSRAAAPIKLSYKERIELEQWPARIDALERERSELQTRIAAPEFYKEGASTVAKVMARLESVDAELEAAYQRWGELDARAT